MFYVEDRKLVIRAARIMSDAHEDQYRDDGGSFRDHPFRVALLVADDVLLFGRDLLKPYSAAETVAAALVHDVVEDADVNEREDWKGCIGAELGPNVLELAVLLCNPSKALPDGTPRAQKKAADVAHYRDPERPAAVRLVKLCDRSDNLADMRVWRRERALTYIDESVTLRDAILAGLWESAACVNYGKVATQNAFKPAVERYNAAMKGAFDRFGALPPA